MKKKPTKAVAKVIAKMRRLIDDFGRLEAQYPGAFNEFMARATQSGKKGPAASAKVRSKKAKSKPAPGREAE